MLWVRSAGKPVTHAVDVVHFDRAPNPCAVRYAVAFRDGKWDDVIEMVFWMREHLNRIRIAEGSPRSENEARETLKRQVSCRFLGENQLRAEGVEDQYVFTPGTQITPLGADAGRKDLSQPVADRTWFRVEFPEDTTALRDENGAAIRALTVGVNVSPSGHVLKAAVIGNLEIDRTTLSFDWRR